MAEPFVQFCPGQSDISCQLAKVTHIDPSYGGGIDRIELDGIDVVQHPFPRPLVAGGVDEIHAIADGFSLGFANAVIGGDWFISGLSRESYVRLRITFAGAARFGSDGEIMAQLTFKILVRRQRNTQTPCSVPSQSEPDQLIRYDFDRVPKCDPILHLRRFKFWIRVENFCIQVGFIIGNNRLVVHRPYPRTNRSCAAGFKITVIDKSPPGNGGFLQRPQYLTTLL